MVDPITDLPANLESYLLRSVDRESRGEYDSDPFAQLPDEIIMLILCCLSTRHVCYLRFASRRVADVSRVHQLTQEFWRSRFKHHREMGFVLACQEDTQRGLDWRKQYFTAKSTLLKDHDAAPSFHNKRRIWNELSHASLVLSRMIRKWSAHGGLGYVYEHLPTHGKLGRSISGKLLSDGKENEVLHSGCRRIATEHLIWPDGDTLTDFNIGMSYVKVNHRRYVAGIRIFPVDEKSDNGSAIGYRSMSSEKVERFKINGRIETVDVAADILGIVALKIRVRNGKERYTHIMGRFDTNQQGVGIGKLSAGAGHSMAGLQVGLDVSSPCC
jgi:F-box domain